MSMKRVALVGLSILTIARQHDTGAIKVAFDFR